MSSNNATQNANNEIKTVDFRKGARGVFVWGQITPEGVPHDVAYELLGIGREIADKLETHLTSVLIGHNVKQFAEDLIHHGADRVVVVDDPKLETFSVLPYTRVITSVIEKLKPEAFLFGATTFGRELAPRVAARVHTGLSADCTMFDVGEYINRRRKQRFEKVLRMIRPSFGESKLATILGPWTYPQMASARPGVFKPLPKDTSRTGEIIELSVDFETEDFLVEVVDVRLAEGEQVDLKGAKIIISGGRGVGEEGFKLLRELVQILREKGYKTELGASRGAVEAGYISSKHQVGQTGTIVRPDYYFAIGISGAIQHLAGMKESKYIIAINKDSEAPIFSVANYGIVGDYQDVVPLLIEKARKGELIFPDL